MGTNTHEEFLILPNGTRMFITGVPDVCVHDSLDAVLISESGKEITWKTYPQWASYTSHFRERLVYQKHEEMGDPIVGGSSACSKCGKVYAPDLFEF